MTYDLTQRYDVRHRLPNARMRLDSFQSLYDYSIENADAFWHKVAMEKLNWHVPFHAVQQTVMGPEHVDIRWFEGGMLNVCEQCVDRHLPEKSADVALIWEPDEPNEPSRSMTYGELHEAVQRCANMLLQQGAVPAHPITIYMPMVPEAVIAMLACARIGVPHSVVFGGFSPRSLKERILNCNSQIVITADESRRGGKRVPLKQYVDEAVKDTAVERVITLRHTSADVHFDLERDKDWHTLIAAAAPVHMPVSVPAEHPLFILYTSGSTGAPKGLQHSSAGYVLYAQHTFEYVFDYQPGDVYWCTADIGWITGHSYMVYGPLAAGATAVLFEGIPSYPGPERFWQVIEKHNVNLFYTAPTAIRLLMKFGDAPMKQACRDSLRILGTVGEPINPEAWEWYFHVVGEGRCAVVDTYWQTETGGHVMTPLPGVHALKPGAAMHPYFGITPCLLDAEGKLQAWALGEESSGALCFQGSWPGQARTIWGDHARFIETYFAPYPGYYFTGDLARRDAEGDYWLEGRMDDVINVSGHRLGTAEIEAVLAEHPAVAEAAVVGVPHDVKGQGIYAFITPKVMASTDTSTQMLNETLQLLQELNTILRKEIGAIASLENIQIAVGLPKTRSGKIMRRILRKIAVGEVRQEADMEKLGDISTLIDPDIVKRLLPNA
jgi:acetyl-CoA synthetase